MGKQVGVGWFKMIQASEENYFKNIQAGEGNHFKNIQAKGSKLGKQLLQKQTTTKTTKKTKKKYKPLPQIIKK